jgi:hypothetical protein
MSIDRAVLSGAMLRATGQEGRSYFGVAPMRPSTAKIQNSPPQKKNRALVRRPRFVSGDRADRESLVAFQVSLRGQAGKTNVARCRPEYLRGGRVRVVRETLTELGSELPEEATRTPRSKYFSLAGAPPECRRRSSRRGGGRRDSIASS